MRTYFARWLRAAFVHPFGVADAVGTGLGMLLPVVGKIVALDKDTLGELSWQVPLGFFVGLSVLRLLLSPYWISQEDAAQFTKLMQDAENGAKARMAEAENNAQARHDELLGRLGMIAEERDQEKGNVLDLQSRIDSLSELHRLEMAALKTKLEERPASLADVTELLHALARKGKSLKPQSFGDCEPWAALCDEVLGLCLGEPARRDFKKSDNIPDSVSNAQNTLRQWASWVSQSTHRITQDNLTTRCTQSAVKELHAKVTAL